MVPFVFRSGPFSGGMSISSIQRGLPINLGVDRRRLPISPRFWRITSIVEAISYAIHQRVQSSDYRIDRDGLCQFEIPAKGVRKLHLSWRSTFGLEKSRRSDDDANALRS